MDDVVQMPEWTEGFRAGDEVFARAWEEAGAQDRALLKTAIAFQFHLWGMRDGRGSLERSDPREGFRSIVSSGPAPWTLAVLSPGYASPARLLAALVPAVLAGTRPAVISLSVPAPSIAAALELAGLDDLFIMDGAGARKLLAELRAACAGGCLALFPWPAGQGEGASPEPPLLPGPPCGPWRGLRVWQDTPRPRIILRPSAAESDGRELERRLQWLHPDAILEGTEAGGAADAVFNAQDLRPACGTAGLLLQAGLEACWTGPSPEFFRTRRCAACLAPEDEDHG